jgi:hypothetical protein
MQKHIVTARAERTTRLALLALLIGSLAISADAGGSREVRPAANRIHSLASRLLTSVAHR